MRKKDINSESLVTYNPKEWLRFLINFPRADTVRKLLPYLGLMAMYSLLVAFLILEVLGLKDNSDLKQISLMHSLLGFVISMLLVFRTNTAYDRWWEGRRQWGALVNNSRNLALKLDPLLDATEERDFFRTMIPNFAYAMKNHLRAGFIEREFIESPLFHLTDLRRSDHIPAQISAAIIRKVYELQRRGVLLPEHLIFLNPELLSFMDICGACERIHKTPIPYSYSSFLKKFIFIYCITLPLGYVFNLHYLVIPFVVFIFYVLASLEVIAEEIEDPFGTDANDLPAETICTNIRNSVQQLMPVLPPASPTISGGQS
ncbi:bestrophin family protein [Larkinella insperata]|uniref:Bestrophin family protein n=1 Tax=Larkinella insperata TaxID=332158 RepID=A0ABW3QJ12_9BACT|nr:bestrophin family ion channel [Larkinella insperata]